MRARGAMLRAAMAAVFAAHCAAGLHPLPEEPLHFALGASSGAAAGWAGPQILPPPGAGAAAAAAADDWNASVTLDLGVRRPISPNLFGIFWEEIGHAGDGGLYAELVQDRSYDALAYAAGFLSPSRPATDRLPVDLAALAASHRCSTDRTLHAPRGGNQSFRSRRERPRGGGASDGGAIVAWRALPGTQTALTKSVPLNEQNLVALEVTAPGGPAPGGLLNGGFWGIAVAAGERYSQSLYLRNLQVDAVNVTVSLVSANLSRTYATFAFTAAGGGGDMWARHEVEARSRGTDPDARLMITFPGPAALVFDSVSLYPAANVAKAAALGLLNPWPFREDLLGLLRDLRPAFIRLPGGCYVEGDWMRNAFRWKPSVGANEARPGHYNGVWGYWSTDGMGIFELMQLAQELSAEAVWVVNNGVAHGDSVPAADALPLVQDALDSIEFITGEPNSTWGAVRASMGRHDPWPLNYVAIGNEDCGKPFYLENYLLFYGAIHARYPHMRLVANCDMGAAAPTDLWDWHVYASPTALFAQRREFDGRDPKAGHFVFASEYAVTDGGAVAEAAFMTGLERNGEAVQMAAYAPLFVNVNDRPWPTNLIAFDSSRAFGIPSYHVQRLFRETQGTHYVATAVVDPAPGAPAHQETVAASATCQDAACAALVLKVVNFASYAQVVAVELLDSVSGARVGVGSQGEAAVLTSAQPEDENSFEEPLKVAPQGGAASGLSDRFAVRLEPYSVNALRLHLGPAPAAAA